jgi:hypothetical protein
MTVTAMRAVRPLSVLVAAVLALAMTITLTSSAQAQVAGIPITGTLPDGGTLEGTLSGLQATRDGNILNISGILNGQATQIVDGVPVVTDIVGQAFDLGFDFSDLQGNGGPGQAGCQILFLDVGPIFLDLLGLQVDLSQIVLDITAVPGAGKLLGNLLCSVAHLLDSPGNPLNAITNQLNRIFGMIG